MSERWKHVLAIGGLVLLSPYIGGFIAFAAFVVLAPWIKFIMWVTGP